ncbi:hypothetical protein [Bacillus sp. CHD6a]|uniref:hypothetical protein n=1 Tax=Bacillus sp. CHD6a TaxID=1643452 RepID=UPI0006CC1F9E|nr:hypothetical protein [Bacillus sp. CHD6a]KPB05749.1 hypothetical protein AAV98_05560 [Bacillus sp. CHD6a]
MRRRRGNGIIVLLVGLGTTVLLMFIFSSIFMGSERKAKQIVHEFYKHESNAEYSHSWELLHTKMREKFTRGGYLQDRAHVFNGHFGADTFSFDIGKAKEIKNWKMEKGGEAFGTAYEFEVKQDYHGKYGHFMFVQYVYVVREDGEWRIVWDYNK